MDLEPAPAVDDPLDHRVHVVGLLRVLGHELVELRLHAVDGIVGRDEGRSLGVVQGQVGQESAQERHLGPPVDRGEVGHPRGRRVGRRAPEVLARDLLVGDGLDHVRPRDVHVGGALHHAHEVRDRRAVDGAAGAGPDDGRDLGHDAGGLGVAPEDLRVAPEALDAFLDARAAGVVEAHDRHAHLQGGVHHLADLLGVGLREGAAEDGEVLAEEVDRPPVHARVPRDHAVPEDLLLLHAEVVATVRDEAVELDEGAFVDEEVDALARRQLALRVLRVDALLAAPEEGGLALLLQALEGGLGAHEGEVGGDGGAGF